MSRKVYDLCRRYQYFHKAVKEVEDVYHKYGYHTSHLKNATAELGRELSIVRDDLTSELLKSGVMSISSFNVEQEFEQFDYLWGRRMVSNRPASVSIDIECNDGELASLLSKALYEVKYGKK